MYEADDWLIARVGERLPAAAHIARIASLSREVHDYSSVTDLLVLGFNQSVDFDVRSQITYLFVVLVKRFRKSRSRFSEIDMWLSRIVEFIKVLATDKETKSLGDREDPQYRSNIVMNRVIDFANVLKTDTRRFQPLSQLAFSSDLPAIARIFAMGPIASDFREQSIAELRSILSDPSQPPYVFAEALNLAALSHLCELHQLAVGFKDSTTSTIAAAAKCVIEACGGHRR